jgi:hypothetical protein
MYNNFQIKISKFNYIMNLIDHKAKYLKYKTKYLDYKKHIGGDVCKHYGKFNKNKCIIKSMIKKIVKKETVTNNEFSKFIDALKMNEENMKYMIEKLTEYEFIDEENINKLKINDLSNPLFKFILFNINYENMPDFDDSEDQMQWKIIQINSLLKNMNLDILTIDDYKVMTCINSRYTDDYCEDIKSMMSRH